MGRPPSAISPDQVKTICKMLEEGCTLRVASAQAGVHWDTFKLWRRRGASGDEPYASFLTLTRQAEANAELNAVRTVIGRMGAPSGRGHEDDGAMKAAQWWLERRRWKDWYQRKEAINKEPSKMSDEELRAALKRELDALEERMSKK